MVVTTRKGHREPEGVLGMPCILLWAAATRVHKHVKITWQYL